MKKLEANIEYKTKKFRGCKHFSNKSSHSSWWTIRQEIQTSWLIGRVVEFYNAENAFVRFWINLFLYLCLWHLNIILRFCYYYCLGFLFVFWRYSHFTHLTALALVLQTALALTLCWFCASTSQMLGIQASTTAHDMYLSF